MNKIKQVKAIGNIIGFNIDASGNETYNVQFPDMTIAELESYQFEEADAYHTSEKPLYLRNVLARLRELPKHDREVWLKAIMSEFEQDFSHAKWREGYEQGKFDGAVEAEKSNKVVIPNFIATELEATKMIAGKTFLDLASDITLSTKLKYSSWIDNDENARKLALAWFYGYEVEKKERYIVIIVETGQALYKISDKNYNFITLNRQRYKEYPELQHTKQELEAEGFGWVFDCDGVEVQEVQEVE